MRMKGHLRASRWVGIALLAAALAACGGSQGDLEKWVAEVKAKPAPPLDPLPVMQQFETFEYDAQNLRDPFSELFNGGEGNGPRPDAGRRKQTLEQFPLDSLDMVGTLGNGRSLVALVMAPDKVTYRVLPGAYLGQSDGRVTAINEDRVELVELVPDGAGGWLERPATILLEDN
jgi:type IV pilus assembly protein PilP